MYRFIRLGSPLLLLLLLGAAFQLTHPTVAKSMVAWDWAEAIAPDQVANSDAPRWPHLEEVVKAEAESFPGHFSVYARDMTTGETFVFGPEDKYHPASTIKVALAVCAAEAIDRGEMTWDTPIAFEPGDYDPEEPTDLDTSPIGTPYPVRDLVHSALIFSSNVAARMLTDKLTPDGLLDCTTKLGGPVTRGPEGSTFVTVTDVAAWWQGLWHLRETSPDEAGDILTAMRCAEYTGRIEAGTPYPELVTHKYGSVDEFFHDGAIVWGERPYMLVVLTAEAAESDADAAIARIAAAAWK